MSNGWNRGFFCVLAAAGTVLLAAGVPSRPAVAADAAGAVAMSTGAANAAAGHWALLEKRCEKCHNSLDWAGGIAFDTLSAENIPADAEVWEKAIRKLRGRLMPPPGEAQPDQGTIDSFVSWMEGELDGVAAANPDPG